jgi:methylmalonyl-CoA/ethylmalonyl-CoA epimerase
MVICTRRAQGRVVLKLIKGLHHVGVAVSNLDEALKTYKTTLGLEPRFVKEVNDQKIRVASFKLGESWLELFEPTDPNSTIAAFIAKRGEGIHHVALAVDNIRETLDAAQKAGATPIDREPRVGAEGQLIAFLHPKSTRGTLVELCQE